MEKEEFRNMRKNLGRTQKQLAGLLGVSLKAVQGFEQGWRKIPIHIERHLLFLIFLANSDSENRKPCWDIKKCPVSRRNQCPAWEFKTGEICWLINGTACEGVEQRDWSEKMKICRTCEVLMALLQF